MKDKDAAWEAIKQIGMKCPELRDALGDDQLDVCVTAYEALWRQISVLGFLIREHPSNTSDFAHRTDYPREML